MKKIFAFTEEWNTHLVCKLKIKDSCPNGHEVEAADTEQQKLQG